MKSLDQAVQKFKILKQKLKNISSQQPNSAASKIHIKNNNPQVVGNSYGMEVPYHCCHYNDKGWVSTNRSIDASNQAKMHQNSARINNVSNVNNNMNNRNIDHDGKTIGIKNRYGNVNGGNMSYSNENNININNISSNTNNINPNNGKNNTIINNKENNQNIQNKLPANNNNNVNFDINSMKNNKNSLNCIKSKSKDKQKQKDKICQIDLKGKPKQSNRNKNILLFDDNTLSFSKQKLQQKDKQKQNNKTLTKKKPNHKKNNSWNYQTRDQNLHNIYLQPNSIINTGDRSLYACQFKSTSLNNSRISDSCTYTIDVKLKQKQKTLDEINNLLEQKKEVLEALQKKIGDSFFGRGVNLEPIIHKNKKMLRAPNLFQMQLQARKRSKSKQLTIHWK